MSKVFVSSVLLLMRGTTAQPDLPVKPFIDPSQTRQERQQEIAACVFDGLQASGYFAQAAQLIDGSYLSCQPPAGGSTRTSAESTACAAGVSGVVAAFANAVAFIGAATSNCAPGWPNFPALCTADITAMVASIAEIIQGSTGMVSNCDFLHSGNSAPVERRLESVQENETAALSGRRLQNTHAINNELAACIINSYQGTMFIGRAGIVISTFQSTCKPGLGWEVACATSVFGLIASLGNIAAYFAAVAEQCSSMDNRRGLCATDISQVVAATSALTAASLNTKSTCTPQQIQQHWQMTGTAHHAEDIKNMHSVISRELDNLGSKQNLVAAHAEEPKYKPLSPVQGAAGSELGAALKSLSGRSGVVV